MRNIRIAGAALAAVLAAGCASGPMGVGEVDLGIAEWDTDGNGLVGDDEFRLGFDGQNWFDDLDIDRNRMLSDSEFRAGSAGWGLDGNAFTTWDASRDGVLDEGEFGDGVFGAWDRNDDDFLDDNEFGLGIDWFG